MCKPILVYDPWTEKDMRPGPPYLQYVFQCVFQYMFQCVFQ